MMEMSPLDEDPDDDRPAGESRALPRKKQQRSQAGLANLLPLATRGPRQSDAAAAPTQAGPPKVGVGVQGLKPTGAGLTQQRSERTGERGGQQPMGVEMLNLRTAGRQQQQQQQQQWSTSARSQQRRTHAAAAVAAEGEGDDDRSPLSPSRRAPARNTRLDPHPHSSSAASRSEDGLIAGGVSRLRRWHVNRQSRYQRMSGDSEVTNARPCGMVEPDSWYEYLGDVLTLYVAIAVPLLVSFQHVAAMHPSDWYVSNCVVDVLLLLDLAVHCSTGFKTTSLQRANASTAADASTASGFTAIAPTTTEVIYDRRRILQRYARSYLAADAVASIPLTLIMGRSVWSVTNKLARLARLPSATRLLRLIKQLAHRVKQHHQKNVLFGLYNIAKVGSFLFLVLHWCACGWHFVATMEVLEASWIYKDGLEHAGFIALYVSSFYWTVTTLCTVGYGDISASTTWERMYTIAVMLSGAVLSALAIASVSHIVASVVASRTRAHKICEHAETFIWRHSLPPNLAKQVRRTLNLSGETEAAQEQHAQETMELLPLHVRTSVLQYVYDAQISKVAFLRDNRHMHPVFVTTFASLLHIRHVARGGEVLYVEGALSRDMWFLIKGTVVLTMAGQLLREVNVVQSVALALT
eukprot:TRINITY_DN2735_c0_g1_i8.p1 TRINITY_DN2735_c0_g1~~TRINITY_DN2735_c0_g1_i8.p1  ORF type:complete len:637 (+),score=172.40 TRINITY_DN2735_c0_g1_i8:135-2045(+)